MRHRILASQSSAAFRVSRRARLFGAAALGLLTVGLSGCSAPSTPQGPSAQFQAQAIGGVKIMPLGDSITFGYDGANNTSGYRLGLWNRFLNDGLNIDFVGSLQSGSGPNNFDTDNEGHYGWRINQLIDNIDGWLDTYQPQIITLMIGTNDINNNEDVAGAPNRLSALIDKITARRPNARLLVASITPLRDAAANDRVRQYNATIPGIVTAKVQAGKNVSYVNMAGALTLANIPDGIHPDAAGYDKMAVIWRNALLPWLRAGTVSLPLDQVRSLQVTTPGYTNRFLRHQLGLGFTEIVNAGSGALLKNDASWKIVRGLADAGCYSLESVNYPGEYLRHYLSRVRKARPDGSDTFRQDATWCARPGLSGSGVSFESKNFPGRYLRHFNAEAWLTENGGSLPSDAPGAFAEDTSWNVVAGWAGR